MDVEKGLHCAMSSAKQRFMTELSDQERKSIMDGIANGTLISTAHGSIDETLAIKRSIESHGGDKQWAAKEWMRKHGYGVSRR